MIFWDQVQNKELSVLFTAVPHNFTVSPYLPAQGNDSILKIGIWNEKWVTKIWKLEGTPVRNTVLLWSPDSNLGRRLIITKGMIIIFTMIMGKPIFVNFLFCQLISLKEKKT